MRGIFQASIYNYAITKIAFVNVRIIAWLANIIMSFPNIVHLSRNDATARLLRYHSNNYYIRFGKDTHNFIQHPPQFRHDLFTICVWSYCCQNRELFAFNKQRISVPGKENSQGLLNVSLLSELFSLVHLHSIKALFDFFIKRTSSSFDSKRYRIETLP